MKPTLRHAIAALAILLGFSTLTPIAVGAATTAQSREATVAYASRDYEPENQVYRLYLAVLDRDPILTGDEAGLAYWVSLYKGGMSLTAIAGRLSESPEFVATYGSLDDAGFVAALYVNVFGARDAVGEAYWLDLLNNGTLTRSGVIVNFSESEQFRNLTFDYSPLNRLYCAFFLRSPDPAGEAYWRGEYRENNLGLDRIASSFAGQQEFVNTYGSLSDREFVELIYKNVLGRPLPLDEVAGPNYWTGILGRNAATRGQVMIGFSESPEYKNRFSGDDCPAAGKATPVAAADRATVLNQGSVNVNWMQNDVLPTGTIVSNLGSPSKGTVSDNGDGTFEYTHTGGTTATTDSFSYTLRSADGVTASATVTITVLAQGADGIPTAVDDVVSTDFQTPVVIAWASNDTTDDTVSVQSITTPSSGTVTNNGDNSFTYTPNAGFSGTDTFTYTLKDDQATPDTSSATVTVTVRSDAGPDDGSTPTAVDDRKITKVNTPVAINWDSNDSLIDGAYLAEFTQPEHGTVVDSGGGVFTYTPDTDYTAARTGAGLVADTFSYTLRDDDAGVSTASVDVIVLSQPECEVFMNYPYGAIDGQPGSGDVNTFEMFFSDKGCFELYSSASVRDVVWTNVTINGSAVGTTSEPGKVLREFVTVSGAAQATNRVDLQGTATLTVDGASAVVIQFRIAYDWNGTAWIRDNSVFRGRGDGDVVVNINPLS